MNKTIIHISTPDGSDDIFELRMPVITVPGARRQGTLVYKQIKAFRSLAKAVLPKDSVKAAGKMLVELLCANKYVETALNQALTLKPGQQEPIYIQIEDPGPVEALPWEALYSTPISDFLALDTRWPIGRIAGIESEDPAYDYSFVPPLRLLVVLAAVGVEAESEWQALLTAVSNAPFAVSLRVFVCEKTLVSRIQKDQQDAPNLDIEVRFLVNKTDLFAAVKTFRPNILHFFCHGDTQPSPHLSMATAQNWETNQGPGDVVIEPKDLQSIENIFSHVWLITLNCCLAGRAIKNSPSLARALVDRGFPAVVGMGDVIASDDANAFCQILYTTLFNDLQAVIAANGTPVEIELVKSFSRVREQLCGKYVNGELPTPSTVAANRKEWMLPILYVQPGTFQLRKRTFKPALPIDERRKLLAHLKVFIDLRATNKDTPGTPQPLIDALNAQIATFESQLFE